jgi:hypothetical protein
VSLRIKKIQLPAHLCKFTAGVVDTCVVDSCVVDTGVIDTGGKFAKVGAQILHITNSKILGLNPKLQISKFL